jgi:hypothetical protein
MAQRIVINSDFGGFGISREAFLLLRKMKVKEALEETDVGEYYKDGSGPRRKSCTDDSFGHNLKRNDKRLINVIEQLKEKANGPYAHLKIVEIPDRVKWQIEEYDGNEWVAEKHRRWS